MNRKQISIIAVVILLAVIAAWFGERKESEFVAYEDYNDFLATVSTNPLIAEKQIEDYTNNLIEAYRNDAYGGDTPEETWQLFLSALEDKDAVLASKYFLIDSQERMREELEIGLKNGGVGLLLQELNYNNTFNREIPTEGRYTESFSLSSGGVTSIVFVKTPYSPVWKIESL